MSQRQPYPAYKDSGVEWLGDVPSHWSVKRLRFLCRTNPPKSEIAHLSKGTIVSFLPMERIGEDYTLLLQEAKTLAEVEQGYTYFRDKDVIVAKITPCFENGKGALCHELVNGIGFGTTELHVIRAGHDIYPAFVAYLTMSRSFRLLGEASMKGAAGQKRVPDDFINDFIVPLPPLAEQHAIAAFLDHETAKTDALIVKKERQIELLREKQKALVSYTVMKGLDPSAPTRDSEVEWLGNIPSHWETKRIRDVSLSLQTGPFGSQLHSGDYIPDGIPVINPSHMKNGHIYPDRECAIDDHTWSRLAQHRLHQGDIVFARRGELGRCALVTSQEEGWLCGTGSLRMRPNQNVVDPLYLNWLFSTKGIGEWLSLESVGATMENLNTSILGRVPLPVPPIDEQRVIAAFLDRQTTMVSDLITRVAKHIDKLREHRTALISAAVTGKIDVREGTV